MPSTTSTKNCRQTQKNKTGRNGKKRITKCTNITSKQRTVVAMKKTRNFMER
jgi:hypothetical protein